MPESLGVIFDMDGVIVHSNPAHKKAIQIFCKKHNKNVSETFMENRLYGRTNKEWIPELFGEIADKQLKKLADEKEQMFRDMFRPKEHIVPGIHHFLNVLKDGDIPMAVATSAPEENADYILSNLDIKDYFDVVLDSSHVNKGKPDPEVYLRASQGIGRKASQCIVFEDSLSGVKAANASGAMVVGISTTHSKKELETCCLVIDDFLHLELNKLYDLYNHQ